MQILSLCARFLRRHVKGRPTCTFICMVPCMRSHPSAPLLKITSAWTQPTKSFAKSSPVTAGAAPQPVCEEGAVPAATLLKDQRLYNALVDAFSMRGFVPSEGVTGHDYFFDTLPKFFGSDPRHNGEWLDEVAILFAAQNEQYLELTETPTWNRLNIITKDVGWREDLGQLRQELLAKGLADDVPGARAFWDEADIRAPAARALR